MSYVHDEMPPTIRRTADDHYQLEGQSGVTIAEYDTDTMSHPGDWWGDMIAAMRTSYSDPVDAIHDLSLLTIREDWEFHDDR